MKRWLRRSAVGIGLVVVTMLVAGLTLLLAFPDAVLRWVDYSAARERLVTGLLVTGTPAHPVVYVTSSDPRTGAENRRDRAMDTNSGIISRLTWTGTAWQRVDLVRGLPRSRQDHATNGMVLDEAEGILYVAQGGNTNAGAPSKSFAGLAETQLSGTVLAVDLDRIDSTTYDLPTPDRGPPFGGDGGARGTLLDADGPVRVVATGLRNPYDLARTSTGALFAADNGPDAHRGDRPGPDCSNAFREGGEHGPNPLFRIVEGGFYGHSNPTRGQCGEPVSAPLETFDSSTNGIALATAGPLAGQLLTVSLDGTLSRFVLDDDEDRVLQDEHVELRGFPLDLTVEGPTDPHPGTIWLALYTNGRGQPGGLGVLEPATLGRSGSWTTLAGTGSARQEVSYVALGDRLLLAGGGTRHQAYDPQTGRWSDLAPLPEALDHIQGVAIGGRAYYVGGLRRWPDDDVGSVFAYDPAADAFARLTPMPRSRGAGGVVAHEGKLYYAGGLHDGRAVPWFDVFDPSTGRWRALPDMPRKRDHFSAVVIGDRLIVTGGRDRDIGRELAETDIFDFREGRWLTGLARIPTPRGGFAAAVVAGEMLAIGGEVEGRTLPTVEAYDPVRDSWRTLPSMPTARHGIQAAVSDERVFVAAGGIRTGGAPSDVHEAYQPVTPDSPQLLDEATDARGGLADHYVLGAVAGANPIHPTSIDVGPDGRVYVAQQNGSIVVYAVRRRAPGAFEVIASETIDAILELPNHDDDGSSATDTGSLVTVIRDKLGS